MIFIIFFFKNTYERKLGIVDRITVDILCLKPCEGVETHRYQGYQNCNYKEQSEVF